ncbi:MAG: DMT family transporter [Rhodospirillales bacterium]|nr:DMT family transporter [Rhodospirillales bacterium]
MHYLLIPFVIGLLIPLQAIVNSRLGQELGHPFWGTIINFSVGLVFILLLALVVRVPVPAVAVIGGLPLWLWAGGLLGVLFVTGTLFSVSHIGAALMFALIVAGQMLSSLVFDHFHLSGAEHPVTLWRIVGVLFIIGGVVLIQRF